MIRYIKHKDIDKAKWDHCIESAPNCLIYALSWYLDIVSPKWDALIYGDYKTVMPVTRKRKYLIKYLVQPAFTQQLGIFGNNITTETIKKFYFEITKHFRIFRISLNFLNQGINDFEYVITKNNFVLNLNVDYEITRNKYNKSNLNNIAKSLKNQIICKENNEFGEFYDFIKLNYPCKYKPSQYIILQKLLSELQKRGKATIFTIYSQNSMLASALFVQYNKRVIYMFSSQTSLGRENRAAFCIIDKYIHANSNRPLLLDFEGSNIEGIANFYKGFGAINQPYFFVDKYIMPSFLKKFINK